MSKISTILVDDEIKNNELLKIYLDKYCPTIEVVGISTTVEDAIKLQLPHNLNQQNLLLPPKPQIIIL